MNGPVFDELAEVYEALIDWDKRLACEGPFYRRLFRRLGARRVLDAACGAGAHAALFHRWGLEVEGADVSEAMIARARRRWGEPDGLRWVVRSFDQPAGPPGAFDAALCVGNSLALAPSRRVARRAVARLLEAVRPGGAVVLHVLNLWALPPGPCRWQKQVVLDLSSGPAAVVKGVHRCGRRGYVDLAVTPVRTGPAAWAESASLLGFEADQLEAMARQAGADRVACWGDYDGAPYERTTSRDLIVTAWKAR